jgi:vesicle-fusing ATPase
LIIATTSVEHFLREVDLVSSFSTTISVPRLTTVQHVTTVLEELSIFQPEQIEEIHQSLQASNYM